MNKINLVFSVRGTSSINMRVCFMHLFRKGGGGGIWGKPSSQKKEISEKENRPCVFDLQWVVQTGEVVDWLLPRCWGGLPTLGEATRSWRGLWWRRTEPSEGGSLWAGREKRRTSARCFDGMEERPEWSTLFENFLGSAERPPMKISHL